MLDCGMHMGFNDEVCQNCRTEYVISLDLIIFRDDFQISPTSLNLDDP